jgi:hypothetical protein
MTINLQDSLNALQAQVDAPAPAPASTPAPSFNKGANLRPNKFGGRCQRCHTYVEAEQGHIVRDDGKWIVFHNGECYQRPVEPRPRPAQDAPAPLTPGVYVTADGSIVKLQENKAKTNTYTSLWTSFGGERLTLTGEHVNGEWVYAPELKRALRPEQRMTVDEAKHFGLVFGQCAKCGRHLSDANSVEAGIGPVCARYFAV